MDARRDRVTFVRRLAVAALVLAVACCAPAAASAQTSDDGDNVPYVPDGPHPTFADGRLDGVSGPNALTTVDLSGSWGFEPAGAAPTTIQVPGGGWYKQGHVGVVEATYVRTIDVPNVAEGQVTRLEFGAVNHEATLSVDGETVATNVTSFLPSTFDLTPYVEPGKTHEIRVRVKSREAMPGTPPGYRYRVPAAAGWSQSIPRGIFRSAQLRVYPALHIDSAHVVTSVEDRTFTTHARVVNRTDADRDVTIGGRLSSVNGRSWPYPAVPDHTATVPAGEAGVITIGPLPWKAGRASYWWPNVPYRHGYRAQLHDLELRLTSGEVEHGARYRFGFREFRQAGTTYELNGVRANLRGDSIQGAIYDRIDHFGQGDAYDTWPGFLPPSEDNPGWPQAVDNYQRLNCSVLRIHQVPATPYMLDVADEMGLMIIDESAIRGSENRQDFQAAPENFVSHVRDLVRRDRHHPSVIRWSQANEPDLADGDSLDFEQSLYDAIMRLDRTRPVSIDVSERTYEEMDYDNFSVFQHYLNEDGSIARGYTEDVHPREDRPYGRGEFIWPASATHQGFTWMATASEQMREKNASDIRPYSMASAWAAVVPGVERTDIGTTDGYVTPPLYGEDNLEHPWRNQHIQRFQKGFNPVLVADTAFWDAHARSDPEGYFPRPRAPSQLPAGTTVTRELMVFNDTFSGRKVDVRWSLRRGAPDGPVLDHGRFATEVPLGWRTTRRISFRTPDAGTTAYLRLESWKDDYGRVFVEDDQYFEIVEGDGSGRKPSDAEGSEEDGSSEDGSAGGGSGDGAPSPMPATGGGFAGAAVGLLAAAALRRRRSGTLRG